MNIKNLINKENIIPKLKSSSIADCLNEMLLHLREKKVINNTGELLVELVEREENSSTVLCPGIAFPHIRSSVVDAPVIAVGRSIGGVDFRSVSGEKVEWIFLILMPDDGNFLWIFSQLLELLSSPGVNDELSRSSSPSGIEIVINEWESVTENQPLFKGVSI